MAEHKQNLSLDGLVDYLNPAILSTLVTSSGWIKSMELEVSTLVERDMFDVVPCLKHHQVISGIWALCCKPAHALFSYPYYIVGQLNYLQGHPKPDMGLAASCVVQFVYSPKRSHELARLLQIRAYLKGERGLILKPSSNTDDLKDVYVDAAFISPWLESEYTALSSMALRAVIPMLAAVDDVVKGLKYSEHQLLTFKATVHEDNQGALILGTLEPDRHMPRSKFYTLCLHWFRLWLQRDKILLQFCPNQLQKVDFRTKPLGSTAFEASNQKLSMGW
eukprot:jgi/Psemu1/287875/fgenesh1_pg.219_\